MSRKMTAPQAFRQAIFAEILNPKTALFFLAFMPQFINPSTGAVVSQFAVLGLTFAVMGAARSLPWELGACQGGSEVIVRLGDCRGRLLAQSISLSGRG